MSKIFVISDTHFNHEKMKEYCNRPNDFEDQIIHNWNRLVSSKDWVIHLGDFAFYFNSTKINHLLEELNGIKVLVRGGHDRGKNCFWWMERGFHFCCEEFRMNHENRDIIFTHEPVIIVEDDNPFRLNIYGHVHNTNQIEIRFVPGTEELFGRPFILEWENYSPVELNTFLKRTKGVSYYKDKANKYPPKEK